MEAVPRSLSLTLVYLFVLESPRAPLERQVQSQVVRHSRLLRLDVHLLVDS